jgi:hypothetical protein
MHPLIEVYALFNITPMTLRRWCKRAGMVIYQDPSDMRCRYLTDTQLVTLAHAHHRVHLVDTDTVLAAQLNAVNHLYGKVASIEQRIAQLEQRA